MAHYLGKVSQKCLFENFSIGRTFICLDAQWNKIIIFDLANYFIISSWLFAAFQFYNFVSSITTSSLTLKPPHKQIETLSELVESKMSLLVMPEFMSLNTIEDKYLLNKMIDRMEKQKTILLLKEMFGNYKYIVDISYGRECYVFI